MISPSSRNAQAQPASRPGPIAADVGPGPSGRGRTLFGKYQLITKLGQGGMATVHLAVARAGVQDFRKLVVLKLLNENLLADQDFVAMFLREARIAAELAHPNVVQTYTVGREDSRHYILMEYLEGISLGEIMKRSSDWSVQDRLPLIGALCLALSGLKYVHEFRNHNGDHLKLVHRDVKPDNIFITTSGQVKLLDFGVAKVTSPEFEKTLGSTVKGTVQYIAPESVQPDVAVDERADVFSAAVILAELATGRRYWEGATYQQILARLPSGDLPDLVLDGGEEVPPALARICEEALQANREDRFQTALELRKAIQRFLVRQGYRLDTATLAGIVSRIYEPTRQARAALIDECLFELESQGQPIETVTAPQRENTTEPRDRPTEPGAPESDETASGMYLSEPLTAQQSRGTPPRYRYFVVGVVVALLASIGWFAVCSGETPSDSSPRVEGDTPATTPRRDEPVEKAAVFADEQTAPSDSVEPPAPANGIAVEDVDVDADGTDAEALVDQRDAEPSTSAPRQPAPKGRRSRGRGSQRRKAAEATPQTPPPEEPKAAEKPPEAAKPPPKKSKMEANPYAH